MWQKGKKCSFFHNLFKRLLPHGREVGIVVLRFVKMITCIGQGYSQTFIQEKNVLNTMSQTDVTKSESCPIFVDFN